MKRYLTEQEQRKLLTTVKALADLLAQRDYHWIAVLILSGMRIREFSLLTAEQVRQALTCGWLVSLKHACKGQRHTNEYLITQPLRVHLQALLEISDEMLPTMEPLRDGEMQPLVWGRDVDRAAAKGTQLAIEGLAKPAIASRHLSVRSYEARLKEWAVKAALDPRISPHWLRHTRGMNVISRTRGKDGLRVAQLALNHQSIRSTGIYTQMSREQYEREIRMVDGGRVPRRLARQMAQGVM